MKPNSLIPLGALFLAIATITPASAADSCPRGFQYEKNNDVLSCLLKVTYTGTSQRDLENVRLAAMRKAERAHRNCAGPLQKPEFAGVVLSTRTETEVGGVPAAESTGGLETLTLRGQIIFTCKI